MRLAPCGPRHVHASLSWPKPRDPQQVRTEQMFSPTGGDARASAPPNARDTSSSMPSDHSSAWDRPHCARSDRGDRDRLLSGKRDAWSLGRAPAAPSYHRASGLSANGSSVGPPSKRRPPGTYVTSSAAAWALYALALTPAWALRPTSPPHPFQLFTSTLSGLLRR